MFDTMIKEEPIGYRFSLELSGALMASGGFRYSGKL